MNSSEPAIRHKTNIFTFRYVVERRTLPRLDWKRIHLGIEDTRQFIDRYDIRKDYMYRVIAVNEFGESDPSNSLSVYAKSSKIYLFK